MRELPVRGRRGHAPAILMTVAVAALLAAALPRLSSAQDQGQGVPIWRQTTQAQAPATPRPASPAVPAPPASPAIAMVGARSITQDDFDRIAQPYFQRLRTQLGAGFTPEMERVASFNVLDELVRRELLALASQRTVATVTQADIDAFLQQEQAFFTNGKFDPAKLAAYKSSPSSNYPAMLPRLRELAAMNRLDTSLRKRFAPTPAQLRSEWAQRNDQVRFRVLPLLTRDMSVEAEATEAEWADYYRAHPEQFMRKTRVRLRYVRLPLPPAADSTRGIEEARALARARGVADSLRAGTLSDGATELTDTGLFDVPAPYLPGLGRVGALADTLARIDQDSTIRVVGPFTGTDAVVVGLVTERQGHRVPPLGEVVADVRRRADADKRRAANEADRRAYFDAHRDQWRGPHVALTRVRLNAATLAPKGPAPRDVERWYAQHGRELLGPAAGSALPPLTDSVRALARAGWLDEQRGALAAAGMARVVAALRTGGDVAAIAQANGAVAETLSLARGAAPDTVLGPVIVDSLLASAVGSKGVVQGPRAYGQRWLAWQIDAVDPTYVPPYEAVRAASDLGFTQERNRQDEVEARAYFEQRRASYQQPVKYGLDHVAIHIASPDSVNVPDADVRAHYDANPQAYRQQEQVKARHILFMTREGGPEADQRAHARADSLLAAIRKDGGDFAELAKRFSQEPGAATGGGDLGWFGRGRMVKEFEDAVFALQPGQVSAVVHTQFGYHIIKVEDRKAPGMKPYDDVHAEIRQQLAQARADSSARRAAEALVRQLGHGGEATALSAPYGGVSTDNPVGPNDAVPSIGFVQNLAPDLPGMTPGAWAPKIYRSGTTYLVLRLRERVAARPAEFTEVRSQATEDMKNAKRRAKLEQKAGVIRTALAAGASLDSLAAPWGGLKDSGLLNSTATFVPTLGGVPRVVQKAFTMRQGEVSDTLEVAPGVAWIRVEERKRGDESAYPAFAAQLANELTHKKYDDWIAEQKRTVRVRILRPDLKGPRPAMLR